MTLNSAYTKCPKCEAKYSYTDEISEKTSGAELWSDGFCMAPMRKDVLKFSKCPACNTLFWLKENSINQPIDLSETKTLDNTWSLDNASKNEIDFIKEGFRAGLAKVPENEIIIRIHLWHSINHIVRQHSTQGFFKKIKQKLFDTAEYKDSIKEYNNNSAQKLNNLIRLANLLKMDNNENMNYLLFAEIYREMGDFSKAMIYCYKAETSAHIEAGRIMLLKQNITNKSKAVYKI